MAKGDCTQSDAQRLEPISETEIEGEDERCHAKASPVKHGSPTAEERSWSPTVAEYFQVLAAWKTPSGKKKRFHTEFESGTRELSRYDAPATPATAGSWLAGCLCWL